MFQRALSPLPGSGGVTEAEEFTESVTSAQTQIITTSKKAKGIAFAYIVQNVVRFCHAIDGFNNNYLEINGTNYTKVTFNNNNITLETGLGANLDLTGIVMY